MSTFSDIASATGTIFSANVGSYTLLVKRFDAAVGVYIYRMD